MADFSWIAAEDDLSAEALTVRAQTISPNDQGVLRWTGFMPRRDVDSTKLSEIGDVDFRPVSDRREWNQRGRNIPQKFPARRDYEMIPVEDYFRVDEEEIQKLVERNLAASEQQFREIIGASIPRRVDSLVLANFRRIEFDFTEAWAQGTITANDPQSGTSQTVSYGFDAARYQTAGTAWSDGAVNAYEEFIAFVEDSIDKVGAVAGVVMRLATYKAIQADAPNPINTAVQLTRAQFEDRVEQELGQPFTFVLYEDSHDVFDDAGIAYTRTKVWPAQHVAIIPDRAVGFTAFAPVARAVQISNRVPDAPIDVRGQTVYHFSENGGRALVCECQVNAFPVPDEQAINVIDAGV